jgi:hypothetical protein
MQTWVSGCFIHELWLILFWNKDKIWSANPTMCLFTNSQFQLHRTLFWQQHITKNAQCCTSASTWCAVHLSEDSHAHSNIPGTFWINSHPPSTLCYSSTAFLTVVTYNVLLGWSHKQKSSGLKSGDLVGLAICLHLPIIPGTCHSKLFEQWCYTIMHKPRVCCCL